MSHLFDAIAMQYPREDMHWGADIDVLKLAFDEALGVFGQRTEYLDIGCGSGFHLCTIKEMYPEVTAIGIDPSPRMLEKVRERITRLALQSVSVEQSNILDVRDRLFNVISCFNVLGNVQEPDVSPCRARTKTLRHVLKLLAAGGSFVTSVYNLEMLTEPYGKNIRLLPQSDRESGDLWIEYAAPNAERAQYYSHWFTKTEFLCLLEDNGFRVDFFEKRMFRLVIKASRA